jgi:hypothetical protein
MTRVRNAYPGLDVRTPASEEAISLAEERVGVRFPDSYREFLSETNGAEGEIGEGYVQLWPIEDVRVSSDTKLGNECAHKFILIGSDGGGEAICILVRSGRLEFGIVPYITMTLEDYIRVSDDFCDILNRAGHWFGD